MPPHPSRRGEHCSSAPVPPYPTCRGGHWPPAKRRGKHILPRLSGSILFHFMDIRLSESDSKSTISRFFAGDQSNRRQVSPRAGGQWPPLQTHSERQLSAPGGRPMAAPTACLLSKTDNQNGNLNDTTIIHYSFVQAGRGRQSATGASCDRGLFLSRGDPRLGEHGNTQKMICSEKAIT